MSDALVIVGGSTPLGTQLTLASLAKGRRVVSIDMHFADESKQNSQLVSYIQGDVADLKVIEAAFSELANASSISIIYIVSGRKYLGNEGGWISASRIQIEALNLWADEFVHRLSEGLAGGTFILISSVNSDLQSSSPSIYGALKAAAESLIRSFSIKANEIGRGSFVSLRLGYVEYLSDGEMAPEHPSKKAARDLLGRRELVQWSQVSDAILGLCSSSFDIMNGSQLWGDYGVHLLEQTAVVMNATESRHRKP